MSSTVKKLVNMFVHLNLDRIENALYFSAILAFFFGMFVVAMPFWGHNALYEKMLAGDTSYKGSEAVDVIGGRVDYATTYPGTLFSTVLLGVVIVFFCVFTVLAVLCYPSLWLDYVWSMRFTLMWAAIIMIFLNILKRILLDKVCVVDGEVVHPRLYACLYVILVIYGFALGLLSAISRLVMLLPFMFVKFHVLSTSMLDSSQVAFDGGYASFLSTVRMHFEMSNPIRRSFLGAMAPQAEQLYGEKSPDAPRPQTRTQLTRNRFWTAYMISKNPELQSLRNPRDLPPLKGGSSGASKLQPQSPSSRITLFRASQ
jgi:hypothetical protein